MIRKASEEERCKACQEIANLSRPSRSFYAMVAVSTTIASYGLLSNSTAVVIGAMLVAPLMGPIFGVALGLSSGNRSLLRSSLVAELAGVSISIAIAVIIGALPLRADPGPEILSRTHPTIYDMIVAVASGIAGSYAMTNARISPALPGVAISTSLVPPLATCGLCLSTGRLQDAMGAFLLFAANFLSIELAAAAVFIVFGISILTIPSGGHFSEYAKRFGVSVIALVAIAVFLTHTLVSALAAQRLNRAVQSELSSELRSILGAQLSSFSIGDHGEKQGVVAVVLTPRAIEPELVTRLEQRLRERVSPDIGLVVRSLISSDADARGPVFVADAEREQQAEVQEQTNFLSRASALLSEELNSVPGATLVDLRRELNGTHQVTAVVQSPEAIGADTVRRAEEKLSDELGIQVRLLLRCVITKDMASTGVVYTKKSPAPSKTEQAFTRRLSQALRNQISQIDRRCNLAGYRYGRVNGTLRVLAEVHTPRTLTPQDVRRIETLLRKHVEPTTILVMRSLVGADVSPSGYLPHFDDSLMTQGPQHQASQ